MYTYINVQAWHFYRMSCPIDIDFTVNAFFVFCLYQLAFKSKFLCGSEHALLEKMFNVVLYSSLFSFKNPLFKKVLYYGMIGGARGGTLTMH